MITIQDLLLKFPHLPEKIFQKLNSESLFKCREVARSWQNVVNGRNYPWLYIVNIPTKLTYGRTYLHRAAETGQIKAFETAFNEEEDKNIKKNYGETMFHLACMNGRYKIVEFVLRRSDLEFKMKRYIHSIDLNAKTNGDETAFYLAFVHGHSNVVKILMGNAGVDLNLDREYAFRGWTVFMRHVS